MRDAGVQVEIQHYEEMIHVFPMFAATGMDVCMLAFTRMRAYIEERRAAQAQAQAIGTTKDDSSSLRLDDVNTQFTEII